MTPTSGIFASVWPASFSNRPSSAPIHACGVDDVVSPINTSSDSAPIGADDDPCAQRLSRYFMSSFLTWQLYPSTGGQLLVSAEGQGCAFTPVSGGDKVGFASSTFGKAPVNGLRYPSVGDTTGWYIWCGEDFSIASDFFQALCIKHLVEKLPLTSKLLALPPGYRFLIPKIGQIDIWFDESLLIV